MSSLNVVNTRPTPHIIDEDGHLLEGFARGDVDDSQPRVRFALEQGIFAPTDTAPRPAMQPAAVDAGEENP